MGSRSSSYRLAVEAIGLDRLTELVSTLSIGGNGFAVTVKVDGQQNSTPKTLTTAVDGREQSRATGIVAATVPLATRDTTVPDGVYHVHEFLEPGPILDVLQEQGGTASRTAIRFRRRASRLLDVGQSVVPNRRRDGVGVSAPYAGVKDCFCPKGVAPGRAVHRAV